MCMKITKSQELKGAFYLVLSAFLYSIMPVAIRFLGSQKLTPISQVFLRYIFAFLAAAIYFFIVKKTKIAFKAKDALLLVLVTVIGYALTNLLFTYGIMYTQVGNALFLFYSYTVIAPILAYFFLKEKMNGYNILALGIGVFALVLLFQPNSIPTWKVGGFFAILSALGQALYLIWRKKLSSYSAGFMMLANTFVGVLVLGVMSAFLDRGFYVSGSFAAMDTKTWIVTALFGIDNFLAWFAMTKGFEYFKASSGSLILLSELVFGIVFAFLFFAEVPTMLTLIGGALVLGSITLVTLKGAA